MRLKFLRLFAEYCALVDRLAAADLRDSESKQEIAALVETRDLLQKELGAMEALQQLNAALERKHLELIAERDAWQKQAQDWQERFAAKDAELSEVLKRAADWHAISRTGYSMFDAIQPPAPPQVDFGKMQTGPVLARDIRRQKEREFAEHVKSYVLGSPSGGVPTAPQPDMSERIKADLLAEQEDYIRKTS